MFANCCKNNCHLLFEQSELISNPFENLIHSDVYLNQRCGRLRPESTENWNIASPETLRFNEPDYFAYRNIKEVTGTVEDDSDCMIVAEYPQIKSRRKQPQWKMPFKREIVIVEKMPICRENELRREVRLLTNDSRCFQHGTPACEYFVTQKAPIVSPRRRFDARLPQKTHQRSTDDSFRTENNIRDIVVSGTQPQQITDEHSYGFDMQTLVGDNTRKVQPPRRRRGRKSLELAKVLSRNRKKIRKLLYEASRSTTATTVVDDSNAIKKIKFALELADVKKSAIDSALHLLEGARVMFARNYSNFRFAKFKNELKRIGVSPNFVDCFFEYVKDNL